MWSSFWGQLYWKKLITATALTFLLLLGIQGPLYSSLEVIRTTSVSGVQPLIHQVAAHINAGTALTTEEKTYLESLHPFDDQWNYTPTDISPTIFDGRFSLERIRNDPMKMVDIWWDLLVRNPRVNLKHLSKSSALVWKITAASSGEMFAAHIMWSGDPNNQATIIPEKLGLQPRSLLSSLNLPFAR